MAIIFIASDERVEELELGDNPVDFFPCMPSYGFHRDSRAQLYSLVTGQFLDDAWQMEVLQRGLDDEGPFVYKLDEQLLHRLADLEEDEIGDFAELWQECEEIEALDLEVNDLYEFLFQYAHFCRTAAADDELGLYIFTED